MKKVLSTILLFVLCISLVACGGAAPSSDSQEQPLEDVGSVKELFTAGTYTASAQGNNGEVTVEVTFSATEITDVKVTDHAETVGIADPAIANIPQSIIESQSTNVDTISGATMTSDAIINAVNDAIVQAGGDPASLGSADETDGGGDIVKDTDVVVVGAGLAGLSAAVKASENGAKVILIEKMGMTGGSSALSGGGLGAANSSEQIKNGIEDSPEAWKALWEARQATSPKQGMYPDWDMVDDLIGHSAGSIDWLLSLGYEFRAPEGFGVDPVERLHFPPEGNGSVLTNFLEGVATEKGVEILLETPAVELIEQDGVITGVIAEGKDGKVTINSKAVILASGGFSRSPELTERFTPEVSEYIEYSVSGAGNTGDGILMAEKVGAVAYEDPWHIGLGLKSNIKEINGFYWYGTFPFINLEGNRFTNETDHYAIVYNDAVYNAPGGSFMVFDSGEAFADFVAVAEANIGDDVLKADTIEDLAAVTGMNAENLKATIDTYNSIATGTADEFGRSAERTIPLTTGPFYAVRFYPSSMGTFGGVKTNELGQVVNEAGEAISGLYAAGEMTNRPYYSQVYMSGSALQVATYTGQVAGENAAKEVAA